jgi:hypothetical protein
MTPEAEPIYRAAREVLLDALDALSEQLDAIVVVGAQAVYLRTGEADIAVAPYTTDADVVLDLNHLVDEPTLVELLTSADFKLSEKDPRPGVWVTQKEVEGETEDLPVDVMVPTSLAPAGGRRGVRLGVHGNTAARKTPGLEAALYDNTAMTITSLEQDSGRSVDAKVAGHLALLVAKAHKIQERVDQSHRPDRILDKDAGDVFRLMQTSSATQCAVIALRLRDEEPISASVSTGIESLTALFRRSGSPGTAMAIDYLRAGVPPERVRAICTAFIEEFSRTWDESS